MDENRFFCLEEYGGIMEKEVKLRDFKDRLMVDRLLGISSKMYDIVWCIFEVAKSSFVSRSYNRIYGLSNTDRVFESVGAHTNLTSAIASHALWFFYSYCYSYKYTAGSFDGFYYQEIEEAIRIHDLCENRIGDIPDNGARDDGSKNATEMAYYNEYMQKIPFDDKRMLPSVLELLKQMQNQSSNLGRLVYLSDKTAALIITLCLDDLGASPMMSFNSRDASARDRMEMNMCDYSEDGKYRASEMWALDFFKMRDLARFDDAGFFTGIIVMATLMVNKRWYKWRQQDYAENL